MAGSKRSPQAAFPQTQRELEPTVDERVGPAEDRGLDLAQTVLAPTGRPPPGSLPEPVKQAPGVRPPATIRGLLAPPSEEDDEVQRLRRRLVKGAKIAGIVVGALILLGVVSVASTILYFESKLPTVEELRKGYDPPQVTRVLARDGTPLANLFIERRTIIKLNEIPGHAINAFLAAEDAHFYEHEGLNYFGMLRALVVNLRAGETRQGGSTITQQVIKNLFLESDRTYKRKIRETILARKLEQHLSKDEILELYLNHIYLGHGRYGVEEAARYYFGKKSRELDLAESAQLAGVVAAPERFSPRRHPERALKRRRYVLDQMLQKQFVTVQAHAGAIEAPLRLAPAAEAESELAPEVIPLVNKLLEQMAGGRVNRGGFTVQTTIDPAMQAAGRRAIREALELYAKRQKLEPPFTLQNRKIWGPPFEGSPKAHRIYVGTVVSVSDAEKTIDVRVGDVVGRVLLSKEERYNPNRLPPSEFTTQGAILRVSLLAEPEPKGPPTPLRLELGPQAALVAVDVRTAELLALIGSYDALMGGLDRATQAKRQPGSAFKPFVYSYALQSRRFMPASVLEFSAKQKGAKKAEGELRRMSLRTAIAKSDNGAALKLFDEVGPANVVQWAHAVGIESELKPTPSLALGAYEVTPFEMAAAFRTFASGGVYRPPNVVSRVSGPDGRALALPQQPPERRVMQPDEAYLTTSLLRSVVEEGTGTRAKSLKRPLAGKTGTTNKAKDAWFVGYSTDIVTAVWVGYDDAIPLGGGEAGSVTALPAWISFMRAAHEKKAGTDFPRPTSIIVARIDPATGLLAYADQEDAIEEEFLDGTVPTQVAEPIKNPNIEETQPTEDPEATAPAEAPEALPERPSVQQPKPEADEPTTEPPPF